MNKESPLIIPRSDHTVSRKSLSPNALKVLYRLKNQGFTAYLVGGCVRDILLGREPKDFDVVTDATPGQVKRLFRNCRLVGRRFRLAHLHFNDEIIEVATFRAEQDDDAAGEAGGPAPVGSPDSSGKGNAPSPRRLKSDEGVILRDNIFGTPAQDAMRRDFTVNALFYDIETFSIVDYTGGMEDLRLCAIKTIGDPLERFTEDPVRMLRAIRFASLLGFNIDGDTWNALVELAPTITRAAPARLYEEILKLFLSGEGEKCYQFMHRSGLLCALFPDFSAWLDRESEGFPHTGINRALDWIDRKTGDGDKVSPQFLIALIFGEYLEEMGEEYRRGGVPNQQGIDMAVAGFLGRLASTVLVPHKIGIQVRDILSSRRRFHKTPGKNPGAFTARSSFSEALAYLRFTSGQRVEERSLVEWWDRFVTAQPMAPEEEVSVGRSPENKAKRSRRRRRHKKAVSPQTP